MGSSNILAGGLADTTRLLLWMLLPCYAYLGWTVLRLLRALRRDSRALAGADRQVALAQRTLVLALTLVLIASVLRSFGP